VVGRDSWMGMWDARDARDAARERRAGVERTRWMRALNY